MTATLNGATAGPDGLAQLGVAAAPTLTPPKSVPPASGEPGEAQGEPATPDFADLLLDAISDPGAVPGGSSLDPGPDPAAPGEHAGRHPDDEDTEQPGQAADVLALLCPVDLGAAMLAQPAAGTDVSSARADADTARPVGPVGQAGPLGSVGPTAVPADAAPANAAPGDPAPASPAPASAPDQPSEHASAVAPLAGPDTPAPTGPTPARPVVTSPAPAAQVPAPPASTAARPAATPVPAAPGPAPAGPVSARPAVPPVPGQAPPLHAPARTPVEVAAAPAGTPAPREAPATHVDDPVAGPAPQPSHASAAAAPVAAVTPPIPTPAVAPAAPAAAPAPAPAQVALPDTQQPLVSSLARLRSHNGTHELTVALHPVDLGTVHVTATIRNDELTVTVTCADATARAAVTAALPALRHDLHTAGFSGLDVSLGNQASGGDHASGGNQADGERAGTTHDPAPAARTGGAEPVDVTGPARPARAARGPVRPSIALDRWL
jgi:hypothetical protein